MFNLEIKIKPKNSDSFRWFWVARSKDELSIKRMEKRYRDREFDTNVYFGKLRGKQATGWKDPDEEQPLQNQKIIVVENPLYGDMSIEIAKFCEGEFYINGRTARVSHWDDLPKIPIDF